MDKANDQAVKKRKQIEKGLFVGLIVIGIIFMWYVKNKNISEEQTIVESGVSDFSLHVTETLDLEKLRSQGLPIIIDFGADSCVPCKEMAPVLKELNETLRGKAIIRFVDVWKNQDLAKGYPIRIIPTQLFFDKEGNPYVPESGNPLQMQTYSSKDTEEHIFTTHEGGMIRSQLMEVLKEMGME